jgi:hypothetical protein
LSFLMVHLWAFAGNGVAATSMSTTRE